MSFRPFCLCFGVVAPLFSAISVAQADKTSDLVADVLRETSQLRGLPIKKPVPSGVADRQQVEKMVGEDLESEKPRVAATQFLLQKLGLVGPNFSLAKFYTSLLGEQTAGFYDPRSGKFFLAKGVSAAQQTTVMAHELTHALQDQNFGILKLKSRDKDNSDAQMAIDSLLEGDATFTMSRFLAQNPARFLGAMAGAVKEGLSGADSSKEMDAAPRVLRDSLTFPYIQGLNWAGAVQNRGGWKALSAAFTNPPRSTEQILHPEKYFSAEAPVAVALPDVSKMLGKNWTRADCDVNGEFGFFLMLADFVGDETAQKASAGWAGDRYAFYRNAKTGEEFLVQTTLWDSETDAREFFAAYAQRTQMRYKKWESLQTGPTQRSWNTELGRVAMERKGARVLVLEGIPAKWGVAEALKMAW